MKEGKKLIIATLTNIGDLVSDVAPITSSQVGAVTQSPVSNTFPIVYNSAIWWFRSTADAPSYQKTSGYYLIILFATMPTTLTLNNNSLLGYVYHDTTSGLYYLATGGSGSYNLIAGVTSDLPIFFENRTTQEGIRPSQECIDYVTQLGIITITSNGGGATHIAKVTGQLSSLSNNLSDILMVSGGGGGGLIIGEDVYAGKDAGGISGNGNNSANQTTGYAFGQGESGDGYSGGGGGLYGGYKGVNS